MTDAIIIAIVVIVLFIAIRTTVKKSREKSSCCCSGTYKAKPRKLNTVSSTRTIHIEGMNCQHCVNRVMEALNSMEGVSAVVNLKKGTAAVSLETEVEDSTLKAAVEKAGFTVTAIH